MTTPLPPCPRCRAPAPPDPPDADAAAHGVTACRACGYVLDDAPLAAGGAAAREEAGATGRVYVGEDGDGAGTVIRAGGLSRHAPLTARRLTRRSGSETRPTAALLDLAGTLRLPDAALKHATALLTRVRAARPPAGAPPASWRVVAGACVLLAARAAGLPLTAADVAAPAGTTAWRLVRAADAAALAAGADKPPPASAAPLVARIAPRLLPHLPPGADADAVVPAALDVVAWWESGAGAASGAAGPATGRGAGATALVQTAALAAAATLIAGAAAVPGGGGDALPSAAACAEFGVKPRTLARAEAALRRCLAAGAAPLAWLPPAARTARGVHAHLATAVAASAGAAGVAQPTLARLRTGGWGSAEAAAARPLPPRRPPAQANRSAAAEAGGGGDRGGDDERPLSDDDDVIADGEWDAYVRRPEEVALLVRLGGGREWQ